LTATVILNTYNENPQYLKDSIQAFENQKDVKMQVIVSTVSDDSNLPWLKKQNVDIAIVDVQDHPSYSPEGSFCQLNNARELIKNDWVAFASTNDIPLETKFKDEITACIHHNKKVCYSDIYETTQDLTIIGRSKLGPYNRSRHQKSNFIADCSTVQTELFLKYTPFRWESFGNFSYWDLWLRIYEAEGDVFHYNPEPTWKYRQDGGMHMRKRPAGYGQQREAMLKTHR